MAIFEDPRASAFAAKIQAINAIGIDKPFAPILEQSIFKGVVQNGEVCNELFAKIFNEIVEKKTNLRRAVWAEQIRKGISAIEWYSVEYGNISVKLARFNENLKQIPGDKEILIQSKSVALNFLLHWHQVFQLWCYNKESDYSWSQTNWAEFYAQYVRCEWLEVGVEDSINDIVLLDGTCVERPIFAINACCYWNEPSRTYNPNAYPFDTYVRFQWNNEIPYI